jgi:hypothetical protein
MGNAQVRWLLIGILACLLFLVVQNLVRGDTGRYTVVPLRGSSPVVVRTDTATGESWKLELRAGGERWVPIPDPGAPGAAIDRSDVSAADLAEEPDTQARALATDEIKALANAILGDELTPDVRIWSVGQLAATPDRRSTTALIQLLEAVDEPELVALIAEALAQRDDPRARQALERHAARATGDQR